MPIGLGRKSGAFKVWGVESIAEQIGPDYHLFVQTISLKLPDDPLARPTREAKARGVTKSRLVRGSFEKALSEQPSARSVSCYDLARDLAGSVKGFPRDLAANLKYMKDFGK